MEKIENLSKIKSLWAHRAGYYGDDPVEADKAIERLRKREQERLQTRNDNILNRAIKMGYTGEDYDDACEYLLNLDITDERHECEVHGYGSKQFVSFGRFESFGEIIDWSEYQFAEPGTEITHSRFIDDDGAIIELFEVK